MNHEIEEVRVQSYKSIINSGLVKIEEDLTALVGENEAGKTNFLEALSKFGKETTIDEEEINRQFRDQNPEVEPSNIKLLEINATVGVDNPLYRIGSYSDRFTDDDKTARGASTITIHRWADGTHSIPLPDWDSQEAPHSSTREIRKVIKGFNLDYGRAEARDIILNGEKEKKIKLLNELQSGIQELYRQTNVPTRRGLYGPPEADSDDETGDVPEEASWRTVDFETQDRLYRQAKTVEAVLRIATENETVLKRDELDSLPSITYFEEIEPISGGASPSNLKKGKLDGPYGSLLDAFDLWPEQIDSKGRYYRRTNLERVSETLSTEFDATWNQAELTFEIDYSNDDISLVIFEETKSQDPDGEPTRHAFYPSDRSEGLRWFLSFYLQLLAEKEQNNTDVILLDDPGAYLHPKGHDNLRNAFIKLGEEAQQIYTTHSPYLLDPSEIRQIRIVQRDAREPGTVVESNLSNVETEKEGFDTLQPVRAVLGATYAQSLFAGRANLLVEGYTDRKYISRFSRLFDERNNIGFADDWNIIDMNGAGNAKVLAQLLDSEDKIYHILLDDDNSGTTSKEKLIEGGIPESRISLISEFITDCEEAMIEDLFSQDIIIEMICEHHDDYTENDIRETIPEHGHFLDRVRSSFKEIESTDDEKEIPKIQKADIADDIDRRFAYGEWTLDSIDSRTSDAFAEMLEDITVSLEDR